VRRQESSFGGEGNLSDLGPVLDLGTMEVGETENQPKGQPCVRAGAGPVPIYYRARTVLGVPVLVVLVSVESDPR
jgi:hypothetical protein